jgi:hypothetical protein
MSEVRRSFVENFGLSESKAAYRESEIRRYFPEAWVNGYEELIPAMTNQLKGRHVFALRRTDRNSFSRGGRIASA